MHGLLGKIMDDMVQKEQKIPAATSEEPGAKNRVSVAKAGYCTCPLHKIHQRVRQAA